MRACSGCGAELAYSGRGRPPKWCKRCRNHEIAAKQRAYREQHKDEIAAKQRAREDRLCGFCREEAV